MYVIHFTGELFIRDPMNYNIIVGPSVLVITGSGILGLSNRTELNPIILSCTALTDLLTRIWHVPLIFTPILPGRHGFWLVTAQLYLNATGVVECGFFTWIVINIVHLGGLNGWSVLEWRSIFNYRSLSVKFIVIPVNQTTRELRYSPSNNLQHYTGDEEELRLGGRSKS